PDVLRARGEDDRAVGVHMHGRVGRGSTAAAPDLCRHPDPTTAMRRRTTGTTCAAPRPPYLGGADPVALDEVLVRIALAAHRVLRRGGVLPPERERIHAHLIGELVDRRLDRERAVDVARCAEGRG